ncbi:MAG: hypothetical protein RBQ97_08815 [Acholeplasma sp.]|nr:hypothetical protein [Acholeplasma sp.]
MKCFGCGKNTMHEHKSEYGLYYKCSNCGRTFEAKSQSDMNRKYNPKRHDYVGHLRLKR